MSYKKIGATVAGLLMLAVAACSDDSDDEALIDTVDTSEGSEGPDDGGQDESESPPGGGESEGGDPAGEDDVVLPATLLIMDASGSMNSRDDSGQTLMESAQQALVDVVDQLPEEQHVGLRVYGHTYPNTDQENGCTDTELIHPVEPLDRSGLTDSINGFDANGFTPIGLSLEEGASDLPPEGARTMILVSDGQETCDGDPCAVAEDLSDDGIELVIHTVGFALDMADEDEAEQARNELSCVAEAGGGQFVEVDEAADLTDTLEDMSTRDRRTDLSDDELRGEMTPSRANTGEVDTPYHDTILPGEDLYYRFEIPRGTEVQAEALLTDLGPCVAGGSAIGSSVSLKDSGNDTYASSDTSVTMNSDEAVMVTDPAVIDDADEVYVKVSNWQCNEDIEIEVEIQLITLD